MFVGLFVGILVRLVSRNILSNRGQSLTALGNCIKMYEIIVMELLSIIVMYRICCGFGSSQLVALYLILNFVSLSGFYFAESMNLMDDIVSLILIALIILIMS